MKQIVVLDAVGSSGRRLPGGKRVMAGDVVPLPDQVADNLVKTDSRYFKLADGGPDEAAPGEAEAPETTEGED